MTYWRTQAITIFGVIVYTVIGGVFFHFLEKSNEKDVKTDYSAFKEHLIANNTCITPELLDEIAKRVISAYDQGGIGMASDEDTDTWDIPNSIFFAVTVITTIGYGHISPATTGGRVMCIFYAIIGIPLVLTTLAMISDTLTKAARKATTWVHKLHARAVIQDFIRVLFLLVLGCVIFVILPSVVFIYTDDWTFGEGVYYSVITLTTIGFGDYIAGLEVEPKYHVLVRVFMMVWIFTGIAWLSLIISMIQTAISKAHEKNDDEEEIAQNGVNGIPVSSPKSIELAQIENGTT